MRAAFSNKHVAVGLVVGVPLSGLFLWLAVRDVDLGAVWDALTAAQVSYVVLALVAIAAVYIGQAARWRQIARTPWISTPRFAEMVVSGVAVNNVLPGRLGDVLRARWLQVDAGIPGGRALATVFVDRIFDVFALVAFLVVSLPFVTSAEWLTRIAVGGLVLLGTLGLVLIAARVYTRRRSRDRLRRRGIVRRLVRDTVEGLAAPPGPRQGAALVVLSLATWSMWALAAWLVARSLGIELSPVEALFVTSVVNLGVAIPSSPGFIGTYQWLAVSALTLIEVGANEALAFSILMHAVWYVPTLVVGGILLIRHALSRAASSGAEPARRAEAA
jgi:uncharacterized membrane protein YbhN (UPF0104 family)